MMRLREINVVYSKPSTINCGTAGHAGCSGMLISPMRDERFLVPPGERRANIITRIDKQRARSSEEWCALERSRRSMQRQNDPALIHYLSLTHKRHTQLHLSWLCFISFQLRHLRTCCVDRVAGASRGRRFNPVQFSVIFIFTLVTFTLKCPHLEPFPDLVSMKHRHAPQDTYCMEFSMRVMVRKAARLAVYEEMTMRANIHQTPIIIRVARVVYGTSPPGTH